MHDATITPGEQKPMPPDSGLHIIRLAGLLKGCDVSPEALAAARSDMWRKLALVQDGDDQSVDLTQGATPHA